MRLYPAYPGNPRNRIEGESPHLRKKDIRSVLLALGGGLVTSVIAAAAGAAVVLFVWRMAK